MCQNTEGHTCQSWRDLRIKLQMDIRVKVQRHIKYRAEPYLICHIIIKRNRETLCIISNYLWYLMFMVICIGERIHLIFVGCGIKCGVYIH